MWYTWDKMMPWRYHAMSNLYLLFNGNALLSEKIPVYRLVVIASYPLANFKNEHTQHLTHTQRRCVYWPTFSLASCWLTFYTGESLKKYMERKPTGGMLKSIFWAFELILSRYVGKITNFNLQHRQQSRVEWDVMMWRMRSD